MIDRRQTLALLAAAPFALAPLAARAEPVLGDVVLGDPKAPVLVIEYASFTCPHCASFHAQTFKPFKTDYIDTGKVRFVLREVYFDRFGLWASMVARCGGAAAYYPIAGQFFETQKIWTKADDIADAIKKVGRLNGLSGPQIEACLGDQGMAKSLVDAYQGYLAKDAIDSTPTFVIEGKTRDRAEGEMSYDAFKALVDKQF